MMVKNMKTLFVNACTRGAASRTYQLAQAYLGDTPYDEVKLTELNLTPYSQAMVEKRLQFQLAGDFSDSLFDLAKQFADADEIVVAAPYWDLSFPAMLKVHVEHITVNGIVFHYTEEGIPEGLCGAKRLIYVMTAGGPGSSYNYGYDYFKGLAQMFGIHDTYCVSADMLDVVGMDAHKILTDACDRARKLSEELHQ